MTQLSDVPGAPVLELSDLAVTYTGRAEVRALDGVSLVVGRGECLGLLGESGSGKSTLARAVLGLLSEAQVTGRIALGDLELTGLGESGWRAVRGRRISLAPQSTASLNPVLRVGLQIAEPLRVHLGASRGDAARRTEELLVDVGLGSWAVGRFPGELSGGQRRLVLLAMALACRPEVVVLDEPTAGLDPATRNHVLALLDRVRRKDGTAVVLLSHDVDALQAVADRVAVLYRGWLAEVGPADQVLGDPRNPYSWALLNARPTLASVKDLRGIRGAPPDPREPAIGCPFLSRCHQARDQICTARKPALGVPSGEAGPRRVACARGGTAALLAAPALYKSYSHRNALGRATRVGVVQDVSLEVREGEVLGLVGATGAGKSTVAQLLVRLLDCDAGTIEFDGIELANARGPELARLRREIQLLFQDPFEALSTRLTIGEIVREPLDVQRLGDPEERRDLVRRTLAECRLPADDAFLARCSHELSGGQLQRVALARAMVLQPRLLVADEAVSMLDPSEQAKMIQLLKHLQVERGMSMVFISHDLSVVLRVADRVLVLDGGRVVDEGSGGRLLVSPGHPTTRALLDAAGRDQLFGRNGAAPGAVTVGIRDRVDHD